MKQRSLLLFIFTLLFIACKQVKSTAEKQLETNAKDMVMPTTSTNQKIALEKHQEGIDFYVESEANSWSLALDFEKAFRFKTASGIEFNAPAVAPTLAQDHNVKKYRTVTEQGELIVQLIASDCVDALSGKRNAYQVIVNYKSSLDKDYTEFISCGSYIPDFRLHDIWAIIEVDGIAINPSTYKKNAPMLEIKIAEQKVMGSDGCNSFRGTIYNEYNRIYFNNLASTQMACMNQQLISQKINEILNKNMLSFTIKNNLLTLTHQRTNKQLVLKHID